MAAVDHLGRARIDVSLHSVTSSERSGSPAAVSVPQQTSDALDSQSHATVAAFLLGLASTVGDRSWSPLPRMKKLTIRRNKICPRTVIK